MPIKILVQNIEDRANLSTKYRDETIKRVVRDMQKERINNVESMMQFFDGDGDNVLTRSELVGGFQRMNILLPESVITNIFQILDANNDNAIDEDEMRAVFGKYMNEGGPVHVRDAKELMNDIEGLDAEAAKDIAKQLKNEVKATQEYADFKLEGKSAEDLEQIEADRVNKILSKQIETEIIGGELVLNIIQGQNLCKPQGKE